MKTTQHLALAALVLLVLSFSACRKGYYDIAPPGVDTLVVSSTQIVPEAVYMDYMMEYYEKTNQTLVTATFIYRNPFDSLDGARVRLNSWSTITFNGTPLIEAGNDAYYYRTFNGYIAEGDFVWTNWIALTYTNHVKMPSVKFPALPYDLQANNYQLKWVGDAISTDNGIDQAGIIFTKINPSFWAGAPQDTAIVLDKEKMDKLLKKDNKGKMYLTRNTEKPLTQATLLGGRIRTLYNSKYIDMQLE